MQIVMSSGLVRTRLYLRAILQESEAKLEMKNFNLPSIFVWTYVTLGDKQKHPYLDRQMYRCHGNCTR